MALTISAEYWREVTRAAVGPAPKQRAIYQVTFDASYPTGGEAADFTSLAPFSAVDCVLVHGSDSANGYVPQWDAANSKLMMYEAGADAAALDEVADMTDLSAETVLVEVIGDE
jgi:hypothetical protein